MSKIGETAREWEWKQLSKTDTDTGMVCNNAPNPMVNKDNISRWYSAFYESQSSQLSCAPRDIPV